MVSCISRSTASPVAESRFPVGSSARISSGSAIIARAMATRCISPPLSWAGWWLTRSASPMASSSSVARGATVESARPSSSSGRATFSSAVRVGSRLKNWKTNPSRRRRNAESAASE